MIRRLIGGAVLCAALAAATPAPAESVCVDAGATNPLRAQAIAILPAEIRALVPGVDPAGLASPVAALPTPPPTIDVPAVCVPVP